MKIKYIGYSEMPKISNNCIYVSDSIGYLKKNYEKKDILERSPLFFTENGFKEAIFPPAKQVLKEEKETVCFYVSLTDMEKEKLNIKKYYDCIDISGEFFKLYKELNEYNIELNVDYFQEDWRKKAFKAFENVKANMDSFLEEKCYYISFNRKIEGFNNYPIKGLNKIAFFNKLAFTPFERKMVEKLKETGYEVELILQVEKGNFDEENLKIINVNFPEEKKKDINIYEIGEEMEAYVSLGMEEPREVVIKNLGEKGLSTKMNPKYCSFPSDSFENTRIYKILSIFSEILKDTKEVNGLFAVRYKILFKLCHDEVFVKYFNLGEPERRKLDRLAEDGYKFVTKGVFEQADRGENTKLLLCMEEFEYLSKLKSIKEFKKYFTGKKDGVSFKYKNLQDRYTDSFNIFVDEVTQVESIETLKLLGREEDPWEGFFEKKGEGILRMILKYLQYKSVSLDKENREENIIDFLDFDGLTLDRKSRLTFIGLSEGEVPSKNSESFLLYDQERKELGLPTNEEKRLREKFKFFSNICNADKVDLYVVKNEEKNITPSSFVEELKVLYDLKVNRLPTVDYSDFMGKVYKKPELTPRNYIEDEDYLEKENKNLISLSYYQYRNLESCFYRHYLKDLIRLRMAPEVVEKLDLMNLGSLAHTAFEITGNTIKGLLEENSLNSTPLKKIATTSVAQAISKEPLKQPTKYYHYLEKILQPIIANSICDFYIKIFRKYPDISEFEPEYSIKEEILSLEGVKVVATGRIDLSLKDGEKNVLVDFKTGKGGIRQLDYYSYPMFGRNDSDKYIYSVMDEKLSNMREKGDEELKLEDIRETIESFIDDQRYRRTDKKSNCRYCDYKEICKMRLGE